jgi:murein DD-endopeptidase MepM/ murein hydrolase activator NlpD
VANGQLQSGSCGSVARKPDKAPVTKTTAVARQPRDTQTSQAQTTQTVAFRPSQRRSGKTTAVSQGKAGQSQANPKYNWPRLYSLPQKDSVVNTALLFPVSIPATITSVFGWRIHPITGDRRMHSGTDIGAPLGTPVLAAYPGEVAVADRLGGYGLTVILRHEEGTQESRYAHLAEILVQPGEWVDQGSVIGLVGSTGNSTGPHLHFEWRYLTASGWVAVDAGIHLEAAMANLIRSMEVAQNPVSNY